MRSSILARIPGFRVTDYPRASRSFPTIAGSGNEIDDNIEMNRTGTLPPTGNMKPNLKASPSLFTHAKNAQSLIHVINTWVWGQIWFQEKDRQLSEGSTPVIFISMLRICILRHKWGHSQPKRMSPIRLCVQILY